MAKHARCAASRVIPANVAQWPHDLGGRVAVVGLVVGHTLVIRPDGTRIPSSCDRGSNGRCRVCAPRRTFARDNRQARIGWSPPPMCFELAQIARVVEQAAARWDRALRRARLRAPAAAGCRARRSGRNADIEAFDLRGDLRKFGDRQFVAVGEHHGAEDRILQLPHIARPFVAAEQRRAPRR